MQTKHSLSLLHAVPVQVEVYSIVIESARLRDTVERKGRETNLQFVFKHFFDRFGIPTDSTTFDQSYSIWFRLSIPFFVESLF